tara:strand:+ start:2359 stop:2679 length:321 start_codon:yes stop_codon:yes gene_type:complete
MSTQRILFRTHGQLNRLQSGNRAVEYGEPTTVCTDYVTDCKRNKVLDKITQFEYSTSGNFTKKDKVKTYSKIVKVLGKEQLIEILHAWSTVTSELKLAALMNKYVK